MHSLMQTAMSAFTQLAQLFVLIFKTEFIRLKRNYWFMHLLMQLTESAFIQSTQ